MTYIRGIPVTEELEIKVQESDDWRVSTEYRWYRNTENSIQGGTAIPGATGNTYKPDVKETGKFYYYCKIRTDIGANIDGDGIDIYSEYVYSDVVSVTVTEAPLPWEGKIGRAHV